MLRFRLHTTPSQRLPLNVRSAGHYQLAPQQVEERRADDFFQLFWSVGGGGVFHVDGAAITIRPGMLFHYVAGECHDLRAGPEGWDYRWITFDGVRHNDIPATYGLARAQPGGACPVHLFEQIDACLKDPTLNGELRASVFAYEILVFAVASSAVERPASSGSQPDTAAEAKHWIDLHFTDARLNVATLAARLRVHRATLHRVFTSHYGVSPVQYLGRLRLRLALELLTTTLLPIADIAVRAGLPDIAYFSKLIARHTGFSPRAYRQRHAHTAATPATARRQRLTSRTRAGKRTHRKPGGSR